MQYSTKTKQSIESRVQQRQIVIRSLVGVHSVRLMMGRAVPVLDWTAFTTFCNLICSWAYKFMAEPGCDAASRLVPQELQDYYYFFLICCHVIFISGVSTFKITVDVTLYRSSITISLLLLIFKVTRLKQT